ncbi:hypothetical protein [Hoeflea sp.]|uniref:hypothetical protein n=1 Tax=Hoeflea sp. TaxID=1940281 RepID=UPI0025B96E7C|nr:hypothetical protein [Hoeflea sp.]
MKDTMIGVDLAKNVFQLHGTSMTGVVKYRKKLSRGQFSRFTSEQRPALVVMEACGSAHYWARELVYLAIRNFEKGGRTVREWFAARNQFAIMFEERFNA